MSETIVAFLHVTTLAGDSDSFADWCDDHAPSWAIHSHSPDHTIVLFFVPLITRFSPASIQEMQTVLTVTESDQDGWTNAPAGCPDFVSFCPEDFTGSTEGVTEVTNNSPLSSDSEPDSSDLDFIDDDETLVITDMELQSK